jgi:hypothetical protein
VVTNSLQDDLLGIPGVEGAEIDGAQDSPAGLRIRIAEGADQEAVGGAIRRVLSAHGLGTDTQLPGERSQAPTPEAEQSAVAILTADDEGPSSEDEDDGGGAVIDLTDRSPESASVEESVHEDTPDLPQILAPTEAPESGDAPSFVEPRRMEPAPEVHEPEVHEPEPQSPANRSIARIESVSVSEGRGGVVVTIGASDGTEMSQVASSSEGGVEAAVVKAAAKLANPASPDPIVIEVEDRRVEGVDIVMIVLDLDGELTAGSAIVAAGRPFALGRAAWAALAL